MPRIHASIVRSAVAALGLVGCLASTSLRAAPPDIPGLLDTYASGHFDEAVQSALGRDWKSALPPLASAIKREAPEWAARRTAADEPKRRLIAATFVLDVAHGVYLNLEQGVDGDASQSLVDVVSTGMPLGSMPGWDTLGPLVEWACGWLRRLPAGNPLERDWFIASVQLLRDFHDRSVAQWPVSGAYHLYGHVDGHLADATYRYRDEPWFRVVMAERFSKFEEAFGKEVWEQAIRREYGTQRGGPGFSVGYAADEQLADLTEMRHVLQPLEGERSVRAEVHIQLGCMAILCGEFALAKGYLRDVDPWADDACTRYLGRYLLGYAEDEDGHPREAATAYRSALEVLPRAPSALTALAGLVAVDGQPAEAVQLATRALTAPPGTLDPVIELLKGTGCTRWPVTMTRLHTALLTR